MVTLVSHHPACFPELKKKKKRKGKKKVKTAQAQEFFAFLWFSWWNSCEEVWLRRAGMWLSDTEGITSARVFSPSAEHSEVFSPSCFVLLESSRTRSSGGEGSAIDCWKQFCSLLTHHPLLSCSFGKITVRFGVLAGHSSLDSPDSAVSFKAFWDLQHFRPRGRCPPCRELSGGPSSCGAATWCGPALLWASWAVADPSCRAAWTAQCCDPCSTPWGMPGTEADERGELKWQLRKRKWNNIEVILAVNDRTSGSMSGYLRPLLFPKHLVFPPSSSWHQKPFLGSNLSIIDRQNDYNNLISK